MMFIESTSETDGVGKLSQSICRIRAFSGLLLYEDVRNDFGCGSLLVFGPLLGAVSQLRCCRGVVTPFHNNRGHKIDARSTVFAHERSVSVPHFDKDRSA